MMKQLTTAYWAAITTFLLQFLLLGISTFSSTTAKTDTMGQISIGVIITFFWAIPWIVLIPALIMKSKNAMAWMCYVCLIYFIIWVLAAFGEHQSSLGTIGVIVTSIQFCAAALHTRLSKRI